MHSTYIKNCLAAPSDSLQLLDSASPLRRGKTSTCFHGLNVATLITKRINIPTSGGLIWLSFNTKTDSSYWRSSCAGMLPWSLHLNCSLNVTAPGEIKEPELDITRCCFIPTCCKTSEETQKMGGMIPWHALPAHWISCELRSVIGLNKTKTVITIIGALWENKMEQKEKKNIRKQNKTHDAFYNTEVGMYYCRRTCWPSDPFSP